MSTVSNGRDRAAQSTSKPTTSGVPLVKADAALLSLRSSGHDFCSAVGEVGDNSLEAGANQIRIKTFNTRKVIGKNAKKTEVIDRVAMGDDGEGMGKETLHRALQLGYSTRYNSRKGLGRFGVGAKLGGISQGKRIDIYSRQSVDLPWLHTHIDLDEIEGGSNSIPEPTESTIPDEYRDLVGEDHGTLVVWSKADRLQERETGGARQAKKLETDLVTYISRTYRKYLDGGREIWVNDVRVRPHDPLYLMNSTRFHEPTDKSSAKLTAFPDAIPFPKECGSSLVYNKKSHQLTFLGRMAEQQHTALIQWAKTDKFRQNVADEIDVELGDPELVKHVDDITSAFTALYERSNPDPTATVVHTESFEFSVPTDPGTTSPVEVTVTLLPERFWARDKHSDRPGGSPHAVERRIDKNEGVSILRGGREIFYGLLTNVQPPRKEIDRFIGIEIRFRPELDECFQVRNVKKGAEPVNGLRDKLRDEIYHTVKTARKTVTSRYAELKATEQQDSGIHHEAEKIIQNTRDVSPRGRAGSKVSDEKRDEKIDEAAEALTQDQPHKKKEVADKIRRQPLSIVPQAWPGNDFLQIEHLGKDTSIIRLNTQHPFYTEVYSKLVDAINGRGENDPKKLANVVQVGLDLLLCSYAQAEAVEVEADEKYGNLRTLWGLQLKNAVQEWSRSGEN